LECHLSQAISLLNSTGSFIFELYFSAFELFTYCANKVCFFPSHTTFPLQLLHFLPSHATCKFALYFVNKFRCNNTDLRIGGSMATPSTTHLPSLQSRPSSRLRPSNEHTSRSTLQGVLTPYILFAFSFLIQIL